MSQSLVPAPNLDILTEVVTDSGAAPPRATDQMQALFGALDKAAAESPLIIGSGVGSSEASKRSDHRQEKA